MSIYKRYIGQPIIIYLKKLAPNGLPFQYTCKIVACDENMIDIIDKKDERQQIQISDIDNSRLIPDVIWRAAVIEESRKRTLLDVFMENDRRIDNGLKKDIRQTKEELKNIGDKLMGEKKHAH